MATELNSVLNDRMANANSNKAKKYIPVEQVDELADQLVAEYNNPTWRDWYCGVINKYGVSRVNEWRRRASEGGQPGKLFSRYVKDSGGYSRPRNDTELQ